MQKPKITIFFSIIVMILSCKSSERIITEDGKIYNVNGNKIMKNGEEVNENLNTSEKKNIYELVNHKKEIKQQQEKKIIQLEKAIKEQKKIEKDAKEKQRKLKKQLNAINTTINKNQNLRDQYVKLKKSYEDKKRKFNQLKKNGKLSNIELKEWEDKLKKLKEDAAKAKLNF